MKRLTLIGSLLFSVFNFQFSAFPQSTAFTYQGRLNSGANPANGSFDLTFGLFSVSSGPGQLGNTLTNSATAVSNGLFTVTLDFGNQFPSADRWLEIGVRTTGGGAFVTLAPRQRITSTPYAIQSANALNAGVAATASSVSAANVSGVLTTAQLPATVVTNGASGVTISGTFSGNGAGVTNVSLSGLNTSGAITWPGNFVISSSPSVGGGPVGGTVADVNGDGRPDVISANATDSTLTVLTNNGKGGFSLSVTVPAGLNPVSLAAADVNADGKLDLVCANYGTNRLTVLTNNGTGGFALASSPIVGNIPFSVIAKDLNGDNKPDLVCANAAGNTLSVLTNNGNGGFIASATPAVGNLPVSVIAADVNGDGKLDLITANAGTNTLTLLTNNGSGGFAGSVSPVVGTGPYSVTAADVNGDGNLDLICANNGSGNLSVLFNNGSGGFALTSSPTVGNEPVSVIAIDVNGDGKPDLVCANNGDDTLSVLLNNGTGGFAPASTPAVGFGPRWVGAADINGDGRPDLISANSTGASLTVLLNTPAFLGTFAGNGSGLTDVNLKSANSFGAITWPNGFSAATSLIGGSSPVSVAAADVNGDGKPDLVAPNMSEDTVSILTNDGSGGFALAGAALTGLAPYWVVAADLNADLKPDLVTANFVDNNVTVLTNTGIGNFAVAGTLAANSSTITVADVNGDGKPDLICASANTNTLTLFTNNGSAAFPVGKTLMVGMQPSAIAAASLSGAGLPDLFCANTADGTVTVLTNNGSGDFALATTLLGINPPLAAADINGDGKPDLITANNGGNSLTVLTNNGHRSLSLAYTLSVYAPISLAAADVNGDGKPDLICAQPHANTLTVLTNNGSGGFATASSHATGNYPQQVIATDLNGDGRVDLVSANINDSTLSVLLNNSGGPSTPTFNGSFAGNGSALTGLTLNAANLSGTIGLAQLPSTVVTNNESGVTLAGTFSGNGSGLTSLNASQLIGGTISASLGLSGQNTLEFGAGVGGKEPNAGKIGYQTFTADAMDIVGAGTTPGNRKIKFWSEGGAAFAGPISAAGFTGNGSGLTNLTLNASQLTSGTLADARLSTNVSLLGSSIASSEITDDTIVNADISAGAAIADTKLAPISSPGKVADSALSTNVALLNRNPQNFTGTNTFTNKVGIGTTTPAKLLQVGSTASPFQDGMIKLAAGNGLGVAREYYIGVPYGGSDSSGTNYDFIIQDLDGGVRLDIDWNTGNVGIGTTNPTNRLHVAGGVSATAFVNTSDRNAKENFTPVSPLDVLNKVAALPITTWNFKNMKDGRHMGPMAQDFYAAFGLGGGDTTITSVDPDGVALAAIQGLNHKLEQKETEITELKSRLEKLEQRLNAKNGDAQ